MAYSIKMAFPCVDDRFGRQSPSEKADDIDAYEEREYNRGVQAGGHIWWEEWEFDFLPAVLSVSVFVRESCWSGCIGLYPSCRMQDVPRKAQTRPLAPTVAVINTFLMTWTKRELNDDMTEPHMTSAKKEPRPISSCTGPTVSKCSRAVVSSERGGSYSGFPQTTRPTCWKANERILGVRTLLQAWRRVWEWQVRP